MTAVLEFHNRVAAPEVDIEVRAVRPTTITRVDILARGTPDRGDDGAGIVAVGLLANTLADDVRMRIVGQLDIDDLLGVPPGAVAVGRVRQRVLANAVHT